MADGKNGGRAGVRRGYTFTISVIFIAAVIIAAASFAKEWRKTGDAAFGATLQATDAMRAPDYAASALGGILHARARIEKNASHTTITVSGALPFRKEGGTVADLHDYAARLPQLQRNMLLLEQALAASQPGTNATVLLLPGSGAVSYNNNASGHMDELLYVAPDPATWTPSGITLEIYCDKNVSRTVSALGQANLGIGVGERNYTVEYTDLGGTNTSTLGATASSDVIYSVSFSDGGNLSLVSNLSVAGGANALSVRYTKSPGAVLVLPFDGNVSSVGSGAVIDYSALGHNMTLGGGSAADAPEWRDGSLCHAGGCYRFSGLPQYMSGGNLHFTERNVEAAMPELVIDSGLEDCSAGGGCAPDDGTTDNWDSWTEFGGLPGSGVVFDATATTTHNGTGFAANISYDGNGGLGTDSLNQQVNGFSAGVEYTLSFWTGGDGTHSAKYRIYDVGSTKYLQSDGISWDVAAYSFDSGITGTTYAEVRRSFNLSTGTSGRLQVQFVPDPGAGEITIYYVDDVSLKNSTGLNGGFEYYVESGGAQDAFNNWAIDDASIADDAIFNADAGGSEHSGNVELDMRPGGNIGSDPDAYIYATSLVLNNSSQYSLEFWTRADGGGGSVRYGVYDVSNDACLNSNGSWNTGGGCEVIINSFATGTPYAKVARNFRTLPSGVGDVELRFYVPSSGSVHLDDVSITEVKDFTISMWLQTYGTSTAAAPSLVYQYDSASSQGMNWSVYGSTVRMNFSNGGSSVAPNITLPGGDWHHLAFAANRSGNYSVYLDGALYSTANFSVGTINTTGSFMLGSNGDGASMSFNGSIDEVRIYQRALNGTEVWNLYRGKYQGQCWFNLSVSYSDAALLSRELEIDYNARLRVRTMAPDAILAMPFDFSTVSASSGAVIDYSPSAAHGTIHSPSSLAWSGSCATGGCYRFSGGGHIRAPAGLLDFGSGNFTVSFWVSGIPAADEALVSKGSWQASDGWMVYSASAGPSTAWNYWNGASGIALGTTSADWTHYAIVRNGTGAGQLAVYVNGAYSSSGTDGGNYNSGMPLTIGATAGSAPGNFMDGAYLDELRVFNRSLAADEVEALYRDYAKIYDGPLVASRD